MDYEAGNEFISTISHIQGDIFIPNHAYNDGKEKKILFDQISQALNEKKFDAIILDSTRFYSPADIEKNYVMQKVLFNSSTVFWPVTGYQTRPEFIYVPINN